MSSNAYKNRTTNQTPDTKPNAKSICRSCLALALGRAQTLFLPRSPRRSIGILRSRRIQVSCLIFRRLRADLCLPRPRRPGISSVHPRRLHPRMLLRVLCPAIVRPLCHILLLRASAWNLCIHTITFPNTLPSHVGHPHPPVKLLHLDAFPFAPATRYLYPRQGLLYGWARGDLKSV